MRGHLCLVFAGLLYATPAAAQPATCIDPTQSWSWAYSADIIQAIHYYLDVMLLSVLYADSTIHIQADVPMATAQRFQRLGFGVSPDTLWKQIRNLRLEVLQAQDHCPLLTQNGGYLLASLAVFFPHGPPALALLVSDDGRQLISDDGKHNLSVDQ